MRRLRLIAFSGESARLARAAALMNGGAASPSSSSPLKYSSSSASIPRSKRRDSVELL